MPISFLNDFIFCPRSIYFHQLYAHLKKRLYHETSQIEGSLAHKSIDNKTYTTRKDLLQALDVFSEKYRIGGKIDSYDKVKKELVERKKKIRKIYAGYIYQLYAQYHALTEMGYEVTTLTLTSMDDRTSYPILLPEEDPEKQRGFETLLNDIRSFDMTKPFTPNIHKCRKCIYNPLCDKSLC